MKRGMRQMLLSTAVFALVIAGVVSVDPLVRERFTDLASGAAETGTWSSRSSGLVDALGTAARHQSIENAPLLVFATVGAVLVIFMVKT